MSAPFPEVVPTLCHCGRHKACGHSVFRIVAIVTGVVAGSAVLLFTLALLVGLTAIAAQKV